jgi:rod shape-determining protein MreD
MARTLMARADQIPGIRPRATLGRQLDIAVRHAFPVTCTFLLMLLTLTPFGIADQSALLPAVAVACVYFWSLFRPAAMPPPVVFVIGLLLDLLGYLPLGTGVLTLLTVHGLALRWRVALTRLGFLTVWLVFTGFAAGAAAMCWLLTMVLSFRLLPPEPMVFEAVLTASLYPALATLFIRAHRTVADPEHA